MKNQVKVTKTELFKDSQVETIVCRGKLVLLFNTNIYPEIGQIGKILSDGRLILNNMTPKDRNYSGADCGVITPIIISEKEEIEVRDNKCYDPNIERVITQNSSFQLKMCKEVVKAKKILALPENFSPKHLQAIVDGKLKDGDEVLVECPIEYGSFDKGIWWNIGLNKDNHIKLFPVKKEESWEHIISHYQIRMSDLAYNHLISNYKPPTRK